MKKCVIITTIFKPSQAIINFINFRKEYNYDIIIVADKKTPIDMYKSLDVILLNIDKQNEIFGKLSTDLPYNHYCRKNLGYLYAIKNNYNIIYETDDDNIPYSNFFDIFNNLQFNNIFELESPNNIINIYSKFTSAKIWPRGLPLSSVNNDDIIIENKSDINDIVIIQSLVDNEPDVDAIYRLTYKYENFKFNNIDRLLTIKSGIYSPFNTQATLWINSNFFYLLYIPVTVDFRFCDILKGYIAQRCLWEFKKKIGFISPFVYQIRNEHDIFKDFIGEINMYKYMETLINDLDGIKLNGDIYDLNIIYNKLYDLNIVNITEFDTLNEWIKLNKLI